MENEILHTSGNGNSNDFYMQFILNRDDFSAFSKISTELEIWIIHKAKYLTGEIKRENVYVNNYTTNTQIKYVLNQTNKTAFAKT